MSRHTGRMTTLHRCPGGCGVLVERVKFACPECWWELPPSYRNAIVRAYRAPRGMAHVQAMAAATRWYREQHDPGPVA